MPNMSVFLSVCIFMRALQQTSILICFLAVMCFVYALFIPLGILVAYNFIMRSSPTKHEATYLPFMISIVLTMFLTDIIKNAVVRPRPDLLDRCHPAQGTEPHKLVDIGVCTTKDSHKLQDGWRSFPSGHSSFAFSGLGFLSLYFSGQFHIYRTATGGRDLSRALLCMAPLVGAAMIAISRCEDYRHDVYDVTVGSLLGMAVAYWSYRRHWPALRSSFCDQPYPKPGTDGQVWQHIRDEEEAADEAYEMRHMAGNGAT